MEIPNAHAERWQHKELTPLANMQDTPHPATATVCALPTVPVSATGPFGWTIAPSCAPAAQPFRMFVTATAFATPWYLVFTVYG